MEGALVNGRQTTLGNTYEVYWSSGLLRSGTSQQRTLRLHQKKLAAEGRVDGVPQLQHQKQYPPAPKNDGAMTAARNMTAGGSRVK